MRFKVCYGYPYVIWRVLPASELVDFLLTLDLAIVHEVKQLYEEL